MTCHKYKGGSSIPGTCLVTLGTQVCGCGGHMYMAFLLRLFQQYNSTVHRVSRTYLFSFKTVVLPGYRVP